MESRGAGSLKSRRIWTQRGMSIHALPASMWQEIVTGRLKAKDLARLESSSSLFHASTGTVPGGSKLSIAEAAARHSCHMHPVFESFPARARSELLAKCNGSWKKVLHFLEGVQQSSGRCSTSTVYARHTDVVATGGDVDTLIVKGNGELYITRGGPISCNYPEADQRPCSTLKLILVQPTSNRILQISARWCHAAFVTENGQVFAFGDNRLGSCGVELEGNRGRISKPALVTALVGNPCQQVTTGYDFTIALTRTGELYSWGRNTCGQLGHGNTCEKSRPGQIIVPVVDETSDPVVQISAGFNHTVAVTKAGRLFTWGRDCCGCLGHNSSAKASPADELRPKRVKHGGFAGLFIVSGTAGRFHSAAIDSLGQVYLWGGTERWMPLSSTPLLVDELKDKRAIQVVSTKDEAGFVLLDNGAVHSLGATCGSINMEQSGSFKIKDHNIQSIACGSRLSIVVTMEGAIFEFGENKLEQLEIF